MNAFGINGSTTDHGGVVNSTQVRSSEEGNLFLRAGDGFMCPKCKVWSTLIKSNDHVIFEGIAVTFVGDLFTCGARLQPKQNLVVGDAGGGFGPASSAYIAPKVFDEQIVAVDDNNQPIADISYYIETAEGQIHKGKTDASGKCPRISTSDASALKVWLGDDADHMIEGAK